MTSSTFLRTVPLEDISIRSGGDGRTVEAYAAVFGVPVQISDHQGVYREQIAPSAFAKTLSERGTKFGVFYNHASTIQGTPSELASIPIGTPVEVRADSRGLLTVTRYNKTPLAEQVLEAIREGAITGQSFSGRFIGSDPKVPRGGFAPHPRTGELTLVTRTEIALREYGPTPFPAYAEANIVGVRSAGEDLIYPPTPRQVAVIKALEDAVETFGKFNQGSGPDGAHYMADNPFSASGMACASCYFYEGPRGCELVDGDIDPAALCKFWQIPAALLEGAAMTDPTPEQGPGRSDTTELVAVTEAPHQHAGRSLEQRIRAAAVMRGMNL